MATRRGPAQAVSAWRRLPRTLEKAIAGLTERDLDLRGGPDQWSIRETVHHLVEANVVACGIVIAALGASGCTYDWSWLNPDRRWMARLGYDKAPLGPAIAALEALSQHVAGLIRAAPDAGRRIAKLHDAPGAKPRAVTVTEVIFSEVEHARGHLRTVAKTRRAHGR